MTPDSSSSASHAEGMWTFPARHVGSLCIYVRDAGSGLRPNIASPGLGLGMPLMAQLTDEFEMRTASAGGTEVVLHFPLPRTA